MTSFFAVWKKYKKYKFIGMTVRFPVLTPEHSRRKVWNARQSGPFVWCDCGSPSVLFAQNSAPYVNLLLKRTNILNFSNKSPTRCNSFPVYYPDVYLQLNMFRAFFRPSSGAQWLPWQPLVLPPYRGDSRAVFVVGPVMGNLSVLAGVHRSINRHTPANTPIYRLIHSSFYRSIHSCKHSDL
jgi:hypothetical protein